MIIVLMGVSGCGKTTVGKQLALKRGVPFYDADDFHPEENINKMKNNVALTDEDRLPWLHTLAEKIYTWNQEGDAVLACSALKESYRQILSSNNANIFWVFLSGAFELIQERIKTRSHHYMRSSLLQSQFEALEVPKYGLHINIEQSVEDIVSQIHLSLKNKTKSSIGVFGLGVMGKSLSLNIAEHGFKVSVYNRTDFGEEHVVDGFIEQNKTVKNLFGFTNIAQFIASLERPRKILIMIKAGPAIDAVIEQLLPYLSEDDIIIDGGNSHYQDTEKRCHYLTNKKLHFIGCGISGGEEGARKGPSLMPGGTYEGYQQVASILEAISAKDQNNKPCCAYIGVEGSGHFIKMVHNGIEYAEMQLLAEVYSLLKGSFSNKEIADILSEWNTSGLLSYLLEITIKILQKKEGDRYVLDTILDSAGNKGTGSWSSKAAFDLGSVNTMMGSAVFARYISSFKQQRETLSKKVKNTPESIKKVDVETLKKAYRFARILNHHQGFELIREASKQYNWNLNLSEIARIWTNGCIIRSDFMEQLVEAFKTTNSCLDNKHIFESLLNNEESIKTCISYSMDCRVPFDTFWSAYNYWISMTTENLPANLIQAQRDFFGAHTYQRRDDLSGGFYHTNWTET